MNPYIFVLLVLAQPIIHSCSRSSYSMDNRGSSALNTGKEKLPNIDLNHWKLTLPVGEPTEIGPPEILSYATNSAIRPYMYNDSIKGALVFYATPGSSTANSSYSRSELREQMIPGRNDVNWNFANGGTMKGTLAMGDISKDSNGKYHRSIIMQIHGRLSNQQKELIGAKDNNGPPVLKIFWEKEKIKVAVKKLKNINVSDLDILKVDSWTDESKFFDETVGFKKFTLEIKVANHKMTVTLNNRETFTYDDIHMKKWGVFENYFKAGNYLNTLDKGAFAYVNYYELTVSH